MKVLVKRFSKEKIFQELVDIQSQGMIPIWFELQLSYLVLMFLDKLIVNISITQSTTTMKFKIIISLISLNE